jgi:hypothetical protein
MTGITVKHKRKDMTTHKLCLKLYVLVVFVKREEKFRFAWSLEKLNAALVVLSLINKSLTELAPHLFNLLENPLTIDSGRFCFTYQL